MIGLSVRGVLVASIALNSTCPMFGRDAQSDSEQSDPIDSSKNIEKIDLFLRLAIRCKESVAAPVKRGWQRYSDYSGRSEKFETLPSFVYTIDPSHFSDCEQALSSVDPHSPFDPLLVNALKDTIQHARYFAQLARKIATESPDSNSASSEKIVAIPDHQGIRSAYSHWQSSNLVLDNRIDQAKRSNDAKLLDLWATSKSDLEYRTKAVMIQVRLLARCISPNDSDLSNCTKHQRDFNVAWQEFSESLSTNHQQAEQVFWMDTFAEDLDSYVKCISNFLGKPRNRSTLTGGDHPCERSYVTLLRDESTLDFSFP